MSAASSATGPAKSSSGGASAAAAVAAGGDPPPSSSALTKQQQQQGGAAQLRAAAAEKKERDKFVGDNLTFSFPQSTTTTTAGGGSGVASSNNDPTASLSPFKDDSSTYANVAKSCLQLTQSVSCLSSAHVEDTSTVLGSALFHDASYAEAMSQCFRALIECCHGHGDRRCRALACKTLAIVAKSSYARIRHSPLLYAARESHGHRLEDEVGNEVPVALLTTALNDPDDGVSASAVEAIGILCLCTSPTPGTIVEDEMWREIQAMAFCRPAPYAPCLRPACDEDPSTPQAELSQRIFENIMAPRLVQVVDRVLLYSSHSQIALSLPCLTACLVHSVKTTPSLLFGMDRSMFAKRWVEVDAVGLIDAFVESLFLHKPGAVQFATSGPLAMSSALSVLRLAQACPQASWVTEVCRWSALVLTEELVLPRDMEGTLVTVSALLIALRAIPVQERHARLQFASTIVATLPSTTSQPFGVTSAGVAVEFQGGNKTYRRPARIALWTEIALSYLVDGPDAGSSIHENENQETDSTTVVRRHELLHSFLTTGTVGKILQEKNRQGVVLAMYDEILLSFTSAAVQAGRRFRVTADGTLLPVDPEAVELLEWVKLARTVLLAFMTCINVDNVESSGSILEEDQSMLMAGQASYVRLLQEYLYTIGLIHPDSSVAFKLTPNACPHLLWVQLSESASFLSKFDSIDMMSEENEATKLMDDLVSCETKEGVSSQHLRLFLLTLAADQWIQGRMTSIRKQFEEAISSNGGGLSLRVQSGREILLSLSPKRLLAKMMETYTPPLDADGKKKRDPIKKLAPELLKACVACIEGIGLIACDWRRRFGSSQETKHLVSVAVGLLQGKIDDTPADDTMKSLMGPICDAAVHRIQAFYESESGGALDQTFPVSDLVAHHVKPKIKPLITTLKPPVVVQKDKVARSYMMQLCQQVITSRVEQCIYSIPPADSLLAAARPTNWLRLSVPPMPESKDARLLGSHGEILAAWGTAMNMSSASSDAVALIAAYTPRRYFRHDGEEEYRLCLLMRAFNTTPISLVDGLRLEVSVYQMAADSRDTEDPTSRDVIESLGGNADALYQEGPLVSSVAVYRNEIKGGDYVTWEVCLDQLETVRNAVVVPSVVYRNVKVEMDDDVAKWVGEKAGTSGDASTQTGNESKTGEDDFQVTSVDKGKSSFRGEGAHTSNVTLPGDPLSLSPMVGIQPCPLVFFCDAWGDVTTFRILWFQTSFYVSPLKIVRAEEERGVSPVDKKVAEMSSLSWHGEAIPGGVATKLWAFLAASGGRVLCVLAETDNGKDSEPGRALHFRGDDDSLLYSLTGLKAAREAVVAALCPGMIPS